MSAELNGVKWTGDNHALVLDGGYLKLVEPYGSDEQIIEAARMSTGKGFRTWSAYRECVSCLIWSMPDDHVEACASSADGEHRWRNVPKGDAGLLSFLYSNQHSTPFEMGGMIIDVQAPIFVFREWHRHRTQSYNEMSARYTPLPDNNYMPAVDRCLVVSGTNKQAGAIQDANELTHESALEWLEELAGAYDHCERVYQSGLKRGIPKEIARLPVPVGRYSRMRASANLRNWLAFLTLRKAKNAQWEIRQYAHAMHRLLTNSFPRTMQLFDEGFRG